MNQSFDESSVQKRIKVEEDIEEKLIRALSLLYKTGGYKKDKEEARNIMVSLANKFPLNSSELQSLKMKTR